MHAPRPQRSPRCRARSLAAGTAAAALVLAAPPAHGTPVPAEDGHHTGRHLTLSPGHGGEGTAVGVRAVCQGGGPGGIVSSPAFQRTVALERAEGRPARERRAVATVRPGLTVGRGYPVVAVCGTGEMLSTSFVHTGVTTRAGGGGALATPTAGGAAALAGLAAGAVLLRRRAVVRVVGRAVRGVRARRHRRRVSAAR